jgi:hypothetical protein
MLEPDAIETSPQRGIAEVLAVGGAWSILAAGALASRFLGEERAVLAAFGAATLLVVATRPRSRPRARSPAIEVLGGAAAGFAGYPGARIGAPLAVLVCGAPPVTPALPPPASAVAAAGVLSLRAALPRSVPLRHHPRLRAPDRRGGLRRSSHERVVAGRGADGILAGSPLRARTAAHPSHWEPTRSRTPAAPSSSAGEVQVSAPAADRRGGARLPPARS